MLRHTFTKRTTSSSKLTKKVKRNKTVHRNEEDVRNKNILGDKSGFDEEERALEKLVFGGETDVLENLGVNAIEANKSDKLTKKSAWIDEDDEFIATSDCLFKKKNKNKDKYSEHLRDRFQNTIGTPKWAEFEKDKNSSDDSSDDEILRTSGNLLRESQPLAPGTIDLRKCYNLNKEESTSRLINSVEFHPTSQVALVGEVTGKVIIFQVDGKTNSKIQSIQFENFPISIAHFTKDGEQIVVGSREHNHFFYYDMMAGKIVKVPWEKGLDSCNKRRFYVSPDGKYLVACGRFGHIHLISAKTKEWVGQLKMNGEVLALTFSHDGKYMFSHGDNSQVYIWDLDRRQCINKFYDEGCITGTCLALSPNNQYLAAGSDSGIVNIYENPSLIASDNPKPIKTFTNLTTEINSLKFNHSSEILAMASHMKDNAIKLAHFPSMSIFSNFPLQNNNWKHITSLDISLGSGYMAVANDKGVAKLFRIKKYSNY